MEVQPGDSLWAISGREYGNPQDWTRVWDADQGQTEDNGQTFTDPSLIDPGWELPVPALEPHRHGSRQHQQRLQPTQAVAPASGAAPHDIGSALPVSRPLPRAGCAVGSGRRRTGVSPYLRGGSAECHHASDRRQGGGERRRGGLGSDPG